mgnify:CR=1 FL=1
MQNFDFDYMNAAEYDPDELARGAQVGALAGRAAVALDHAQDAFWAVMVDHFPEVESGDFDPMHSMRFDEELKCALWFWLYWNLPHTGHPENCDCTPTDTGREDGEVWEVK